MKKLTIIHKITFSALFIGLAVVLSRFLSVPYLFGVSFLKVSFNPTIVMFSSIFLGPWWGALIGGASDILGAILIPQGGAFNPMFTIPAIITGLMPGLLYKYLGSKIDKKFPVSLTIVLSLITLFIVIIFATNNVTTMFKVRELDTWVRIVIPIVSVLISTILLLSVIFIKRKLTKGKLNVRYNIYGIGSSLYLTYFVFKIPISSLIKMFFIDGRPLFWYVFISETAVGFFTCFIHYILILMILRLTISIRIPGELENREEAYGK